MSALSVLRLGLANTASEAPGSTSVDYRSTSTGMSPLVDFVVDLTIINPDRFLKEPLEI